MSDSEDKELIIRRAVFGKQVENFLSSEIGRYILGRAASEAADAYKKLRDADICDINGIKKYQNQILRAEGVKNWLEDVVFDGLQALEILEDRE